MFNWHSAGWGQGCSTDIQWIEAWDTAHPSQCRVMPCCNAALWCKAVSAEVERRCCSWWGFTPSETDYLFGIFRLKRERDNAKGHFNVFTVCVCAGVPGKGLGVGLPSTLFETESVCYLLLTHKIPAIFLSLPPASWKGHCGYRSVLLCGSGLLHAHGFLTHWSISSALKQCSKTELPSTRHLESI